MTSSDTASVVPREAARIDCNEWLSEAFHRPGGRWIAQRVAATRVTPNQLTILGGIIGVIAGLLLMAGARQPGLRLAGGIVLWVACLFDCADGELARARKQQSALGMMLDGLTDNAVGTTVFLAMSYDILVYTGRPLLGLLGIAAGFSAGAHVWVYDARKKQYLQCIGLAEPEQPISALAVLRRQASEEGRRFDAFLLGAYWFFRRMQSLGVGFATARDPRGFRQANRRRMLAWTSMGSSIHLIALYVAAIASPFWPPAMLACAMFYAVVLNLMFVFLLLGRWDKAGQTSQPRGV